MYEYHQLHFHTPIPHHLSYSAVYISIYIYLKKYNGVIHKWMFIVHICITHAVEFDVQARIRGISTHVQNWQVINGGVDVGNAVFRNTAGIEGLIVSEPSCASTPTTKTK